jgi:gentisate 1,2-dioxygenase
LSSSKVDVGKPRDKGKSRKGLHPFVAYLIDRFPNYDKWVKAQGVPNIEGHFVADCRAAELFEWERTGGTGVFINLSNQTVDDAFLVEIPRGGSLNPDRHMYEEIVYVVSGRGATKVWNEGADPIQFEWQAGSLFAIPLNANYQHFNGDGENPARLLGVTSAPLTINLFHSTDFVFGTEFAFEDRFAEGALFDGTKKLHQVADWGVWETNFVADVRRLELMDNPARGKGQTIFIALSSSTMKVHISRFPSATYKKAHRHGPGAHIYILDGEGYSLMWPTGEEPQRFDWSEGALISPPDGWYHQHFNLGDKPATYLGLHRPVVIGGSTPTHQIEYEDEESAIRQDYEAELRARGIEPQMDGVRAGE